MCNSGQFHTQNEFWNLVQIDTRTARQLIGSYFIMNLGMRKAEFILEHQAIFQCWTVSCSVSIQTQCHRSARNCSRRAFSDDHQNHVSWAWNTLEVEILSTHGGASLFWQHFDIDLPDAHDLKNGNGHARERWKNALRLNMNSAYATHAIVYASNQVWMQNSILSRT